MRGVALAVPVVVLALMHVLQRMEVWATSTSERTATRARAAGPREAKAAAPPVRQSEVPRRRVEGEASQHG